MARFLMLPLINLFCAVSALGVYIIALVGGIRNCEIHFLLMLSFAHFELWDIKRQKK